VNLRWPGEDEVHETEAEGGDEGVALAGSGVAEDGGGVEGDDVDSACGEEDLVAV
jgi:hypothetical protein